MFLRKPFFFSCLVHLFILLFLGYAKSVPFYKPKTRVLWVKLPKGISETVDIKIRESKDLPQTTVKEQKEAVLQEVAEKKVREKKERELAAPPPKKRKLRPIQPELPPKLRKVEPKKREKTDWEKALAKLDTAKKSAPPEAAQVKEKGEGFRHGTGTEPLKVLPSDPEYLVYQSKIIQKIYGEWILPPAYLQGPSPPIAKIIVFINEIGAIVSQQWESPSGNTAYDASCFRAVQRASPLPLPPERLAWEVYNEGLLIDFDPSLKNN